MIPGLEAVTDAQLEQQITDAEELDPMRWPLKAEIIAELRSALASRAAEHAAQA